MGPTSTIRVLLTGAAGGVGVHVLAHIMVNTDWQVIVLDSFRHKGYRDRIARVCKYHPDWTTRIAVFKHDLVCPISPELVDRIGPVDYIIHLAALSDVFFSVENPVYTIKNNIESTLTILEYARQVKPKAFLYFSTDEVYGPVPNGAAHKEWETHRPSNPYSASKAACEDICYTYWRSYDVPLIITNTMNNFGQMQGDSKFPVLIQNSVANRTIVTIHANRKEIGTRFYLHSRNAADAVLFILNLPVTHHAIGELDEPDRYNIVGDKSLTNLELAETIARLMGRQLKYELVDFHRDNPAHDIHYGLDGAKMKRLGWESPVDFETSLRSTIEWQQRNPEWL